MRVVRIERRKRGRIDKALYIMLIPGVVLTLIYAYGPLFGLVIAFQDFSIARGIFDSPLVGFDNFVYLFKYYPDFMQKIVNTVTISVWKMIFNFLAPLCVALLLNELPGARFRRSIQTIIYLPHFISWVVIAGILITMLHPTDGIVNRAIMALGFDPVYFLGDKNVIRSVLVSSDVWKNFGYGTIIYMAALTGIDPTLYEAVTIDGAGRWKRIRHITLPGIAPIIVLVITLNMGGILNAGFDQIFNLYNPSVYATADVLDTFTYRLGITGAQYDLSTAVSLIKSVVSALLVSATYFIAYKKADYRIF